MLESLVCCSPLHLIAVIDSNHRRDFLIIYFILLCITGPYLCVD